MYDPQINVIYPEVLMTAVDCAERPCRRGVWVSDSGEALNSIIGSSCALGVRS